MTESSALGERCSACAPPDSRRFGYESIRFPDSTQIKFSVSWDTGSYTPGHWHSALELIYILDGEAVVSSEGRTSVLKKDDFILINSRTVHTCTCPRRNRAILIQIPDSLLRPYLPDYDSIRFCVDTTDPEGRFAAAPRERQAAVRSLILSMKELTETQSPGFLLGFTGLAFRLMELLYRFFCMPLPPGAAAHRLREQKAAAQLDRVLAFTERHYAEPVSLADAARAASLQPEYFCRFFRRSMGMTYIQYLNDYRLSRVYRDLLCTSLPVGRLLELHGFTNDKLFRRLFRERFGSTPLAVRKAASGAASL